MLYFSRNWPAKVSSSWNHL